MTTDELLASLPFLVLGGAVVLVMLATAIRRHHLMALLLTLLGLAAAFGSLFTLHTGTGARRVTALLLVDDYALFFLGLILLASIAVVLLSFGYLEVLGGAREEYYLLLLLATLGSATLIASTHFASFFLGLEILSVSLYALIAYARGRPLSVEAGIKYLILAGTSSAFLLFGMALVYAELGTMEFGRIGSLISSGNKVPALLMMGLTMVIVGIGFKLAVVPFHMWTPDVYQGSPAPATAFVATVSKGAMYALLLRFFTPMGIHAHWSLFLVFAIIAVASMVAGNLLALLQTNVKRILAYSSIAHLGYLLVPFLAGSVLGIRVAALYLATYFATTLGAFGVVTVLSGGDGDAENLDTYRGLGRERPWLAGVFAAMLLSLAGLPLTAGFVAKFFLVSSGVGAALWVLVVVLVVTSGIGVFYYLRVIAAMYLQPRPEGAPGAAAPSFTWSSGIVLAVLALVLLWLGIYPSPLLQLIEAMVAL